MVQNLGVEERLLLPPKPAPVSVFIKVKLGVVYINAFFVEKNFIGHPRNLKRIKLVNYFVQETVLIRSWFPFIIMKRDIFLGVREEKDQKLPVPIIQNGGVMKLDTTDYIGGFGNILVNQANVTIVE